MTADPLQPADPFDVGSEPELVDRIRSEIELRGPMTFARFMELALYEPGLGYYRSDRPRPGRAGDFLTAPETHPIFGHAIARQLEEMWSILGLPAPFVVREYGAGEGALALAALEGLRRDDSALSGAVRWDPVEIDPRRTAELSARLSGAGFGGALAPVRPPFTGVVLANEFLDALPVHRVAILEGTLRELYVAWRDDRFEEVVAPPSTPALAERLAREGAKLTEGARAEICLELEAWVREAAETLTRGYILVIDYGHSAAELYGPQRRSGTLRAYVRHAAHDDPFRNIGRQDLTAHVDITALQDLARLHGFDVVGVTTQAEFLAGVGGDELLETARVEAATYDEYLGLRSAVARLLDPRAMGAFRVVVLGRELGPARELSGLSYQLARSGPGATANDLLRPREAGRTLRRPGTGTAGGRGTNLHARSACPVPRPPPPTATAFLGRAP
jgi:SAM-dependent MidA family methyltransferase